MFNHFMFCTEENFNLPIIHPCKVIQKEMQCVDQEYQENVETNQGFNAGFFEKK